MAPRNRALFAFVGLCSAIAAGCSGGSKSGGTPPTPTATPTVVASASASASGSGNPSPTPSPNFVLSTATPIPAATAAPTGATNAVTARPLANGDVFQYSGTSTQTFVYTGTSPSPSAATTTSITQKTTVATGKTFNGTSNLDEFETAETDATARQTTTISTDTYYGFGTSTGPTNSSTTGIEQTPLTLYGSTSSASSGETVSISLASAGYPNDSGTVDLLPEENASTSTWTNGIAETYVQNESDGFSATRTYNADGSYTENDTYPQTTAASPQPAAETATIVQKSDGSGSYSVPLFSGPNDSITYTAPTSAGLIDVTLNDSYVFQVSAWFPQPLSSSKPAYSEIDRDNGAVTYPSACGFNAGQYDGSTTGNELEQKFTRIDTILGDLEFFDQLTFVAPNGVAACVQLSDVTYSFYDFSGQTNTDQGPGFQGGNNPYQTTTIATTLALSATPTLNFVERNADLASAGSGPVGISASAVANARANFLTTVDHYRALRERKMFAKARAFLARHHR